MKFFKVQKMGHIFCVWKQIQSHICRMVSATHIFKLSAHSRKSSTGHNFKNTTGIIKHKNGKELAGWGFSEYYRIAPSPIHKATVICPLDPVFEKLFWEVNEAYVIGSTKIGLIAFPIA